MIKLAQTETKVFVELTKPEFKMIAKVGPGTIGDGSAVDISWLSKVITFGTGQAAALTTAKTQAESLSATLTDLITNTQT